MAVVGEPGSGQTTYARLIAERYGLQTASMSDKGMSEKLRAKVAAAGGGGPGIMGSFQKAMSEVMVDRVAEMVSSPGAGIVLDGWPRSTQDLKGLSEKGVALDKLIYLDVGEDEEEAEAGLMELRQALGPSRVVQVENDDRGVKGVFKEVAGLLDPLLKGRSKDTDAAAAAASSSPPPSSKPAASAPSTADTKDLPFGGLLVSGRAAASLRARGITRATQIQEAAMPRIRRGDNVLIHAETGSGKTLAYALPVLQMLEDDAPRQVLVVTPTRELAVQVAGEIVGLQEDPQGSGVALLLEPGQGLAKVQAPVVVATSKVMWGEMVASNTTKTMLSDALSNLRCVIMDEVDRCITPLGAYATLKEKRQKARHPKPASLLLAEIYIRLGLKPQFVGASATIGRPLKRELAGSMGVDPKLEGPLTIRADEPPLPPSESSSSNSSSKNKPPPRAVSIPASIRHFYLAVPDDDLELKVRAVRDYLNDKRPARPIVFLPGALSVTDATQRLKRAMAPHGWEVCALHEALGFAGGGEKKESLDWRTPWRSTETESTRLLVTSAETARGLDLKGIDCVMVFGRVDGPDEYQHVAGRTGRQGARGVVVSVLSYVDVKKLSAFESMLGIHFKQAVLGTGPMRS